MVSHPDCAVSHYIHAHIHLGAIYSMSDAGHRYFQRIRAWTKCLNFAEVRGRGISANKRWASVETFDSCVSACGPASYYNEFNLNVILLKQIGEVL